MDKTETAQRPQHTSQGSKRPYAAPAIAWEEPWEAHANLMAACATKDIMQPGCETEPIS